ncbi:MAG: PQQ-dependent sugar dehydrogenase [Thermoproteota archaeon]|nr:PQQ-dependent sugar dehydrogenase [Thermoproteota archaeon]
MKVSCRVLSLIGTILILIIQMSIIAHGQPSSTQLFGCQRYGGVMHCDLLLNDLEATEAQGNSTLINNLTSKDVLYVNGKIGQSMQMRGEYRESVEIMNSPELSPNQFSVSFWMRSTTIEPYGVIVSHSNRPQTSGWQFDTFKAASSQSGSEAATLRFGVFNTNGTSFSPPTIEVPTDRFTLITGTFDGSRVRLFMDGQLVGEREFRGSYNWDPGLPMRIGSPSYCSSCNRWSGIIDDLRIYGRILADQEVRELYDMSDVSSGLMGYWKFDGDTNDSLQRHNGTAITMLTSMVFAPDGRLFFNEKNTGEIRVMTPQQNILDKPFASVSDLFASWEQGMLGLAIDPEFDSNHYLYLYYTALIDTQSEDEGKVINRVVRFTDINNTGTDMRVILDNIPASRGYHSGGAMTFGPDGKLYITVGDATEHIFAQDPSIVIGKVLRINKDGSIPEDNPYPNLPVYTIGHRNLYGIAFDNNGTGLVAENGEARYDEINLITKGGNYGFPTSQPANLPPERSNDSSIKPLRSYWDTIAPTQMIYYTGDAVPELKGMFVFGSFTGDIYALKMSEDSKRIVQEIHIDLEHYPFVPTVGIAQSPDGKIYYGGYQIYTLDSIGEREQALFTIRLDSPQAVDVGEIKVDEKQKKITIDADVKERLDPDSKLIAQIPRALLDNVTNVAAKTKQGSNVMEISVNEFGPDYTTISMNIGSQGQSVGTIELTIS